MIPPKLISADVVGEYAIRLSYADGTNGIVNLEPELDGGIFFELKDPSVFRKFKINFQFGTLEWDNGADFSPEFLYQATQAGR